MRHLLLGAAVLAAMGHPACAQDLEPLAASEPAATGKFLVFFELDRSVLTPEGMAVVGQAAAAFERDGMAQLAVNGHTDLSGSMAYNQMLSERRAEAVRAELVRQGVPLTAISMVAEGEAHPLVPTADGVREGQNRRVEIELPQPPVMARAPIVVAPARAAPVVPVAAVAPRQSAWSLALGAIYGVNLQESDDRNQSNLVGGEASLGYTISPSLAFSFEQAVMHSFNAVDEGWSGRSVLGLDLQAPLGAFKPYLGANVGAVYGASIQDGIVAGPELGLKVDLSDSLFLYGKAAYDYQFRNSEWDEGTILGGAGVGMRF